MLKAVTALPAARSSKVQRRSHPALHVSFEKYQIGKVCILEARCLHSCCLAVRNVRVQLHSEVAQSDGGALFDVAASLC